MRVHTCMCTSVVSTDGSSIQSVLMYTYVVNVSFRKFARGGGQKWDNSIRGTRLVTTRAIITDFQGGRTSFKEAH